MKYIRFLFALVMGLLKKSVHLSLTMSLIFGMAWGPFAIAAGEVVETFQPTAQEHQFKDGVPFKKVIDDHLYLLEWSGQVEYDGQQLRYAEILNDYGKVKAGNGDGTSLFSTDQGIGGGAGNAQEGNGGSQSSGYSPSGSTGLLQGAMGAIGTAIASNPALLGEIEESNRQIAKYGGEIARSKQAMARSQADLDATFDRLIANAKAEEQQPVRNIGAAEVAPLSDEEMESITSSFDQELSKIQWQSTDPEFIEEADAIRNSLLASNITSGIDQKFYDISKNALIAADKYHSRGDFDASEYLLDLSKKAADLLVGLNPISGTMQSLYELVTGEGLFSGEPLSTFERVMAAAGLFTGGYALRAGKILKWLKPIASKMADPLMKTYAGVEKFARTLARNGTKWDSVKGLLHTTKGNLVRHADGTIRLKNGMHTEEGLRHFLRRASSKGQKYAVETTSNFAEKASAGSILTETMPNGVKRVQLPREAFINSEAWVKSKIKLSNGNHIRGSKTLWPETFGPEDIAEAANSVLKSNPGIPNVPLEGVYKGIKFRAWLDEHGKVATAFPTWEQI